MTIKGAGFWNRIAPKYSRSPIADEVAYQKKLQMTQAHFKPDWDVLEIGCGTGSTAIIHAPFVRQIRAVDFSDKMIEIAKAKAAEKQIENISFEVSDIDTLTVGNESQNAVLALSVLHLLKNRDEAIRRIHNMLKPGGIFVSSTACIADFMFLLKYILPAGRFFRLLPYVSVFSRHELESSIKSAGFTIEDNWQPDRKKAVFIIARKSTA